MGKQELRLHVQPMESQCSQTTGNNQSTVEHEEGKDILITLPDHCNSDINDEDSNNKDDTEGGKTVSDGEDIRNGEIPNDEFFHLVTMTP